MSRNLKRPGDDAPVSGGMDERGWKIMRNLGYHVGEGLGSAGQGALEPVAISMQKGRRGLGLQPSSLDSTHAIKHSTDPRLVWREDHELDSSILRDRIWKWRRSKKSAVEVDTIRNALLSPDDDQACGEKITALEREVQFCSARLVEEMIVYKNQLDRFQDAQVTESHRRSNPHELLGKGIFMNRAAMKLANMDALLDGLFTDAVPRDTILHFADVCAGPGGFSEYLLWRRCNAPPLTSSPDCGQGINQPIRSGLLNVKGYGLTLTGNCDFRLSDMVAGPAEAFMAHYGQDKDGDITKWVNLSSFAALIAKATQGQGVHVLVADGGFDVSGHNNLQEVLSKRIYLCQCLCALILLRPGGHFLTKLFDTFTEFSVHLIFLMAQVFEEIYIIKPVTSRPANSERYLVCKNLQSLSSQMAGCPDPPRTTESLNSESTTPRFKKRPQPATNGDNEPMLPSFNRDKLGLLGDLIDHFLEVNEAQGRMSGLTSSGKSDVLRICRPQLLSDDFREFITKTNEEFAEAQCVALSKLLTFAGDPTRSTPNQAELRLECLQQWKIPDDERKRVPWPLLSSHHSSVIHDILGDSEKKKALNSLSHQDIPSYREMHLSIRDRSELDSLVDKCLALVCPGWPISTSPQHQPMLIYSRDGQAMDLQYSTDGMQWSHLSTAFEHLCPRLPAGTLVWAQPMNEYIAKRGLRKYALAIFDVACIYGFDCRHLPYTTRMELAERMAEVVNFPGMKASFLRVPPIMRHLRMLPSFVNDLPLRSHKDVNQDVPVYIYPDGCFFQPKSILIVKHLKDDWLSVISRTHGKVYYFNVKTEESTFDLEGTDQHTFSRTSFLQIPWQSNDKDSISVPQLIEYLAPRNT